MPTRSLKLTHLHEGISRPVQLFSHTNHITRIGWFFSHEYGISQGEFVKLAHGNLALGLPISISSVAQHWRTSEAVCGYTLKEQDARVTKVTDISRRRINATCLCKLTEFTLAGFCLLENISNLLCYKLFLINWYTWSKNACWGWFVCNLVTICK